MFVYPLPRVEPEPPDVAESAMFSQLHTALHYLLQAGQAVKGNDYPLANSLLDKAKATVLDAMTYMPTTQAPS